jgi:hypothetical protein
MSYEEIAAQYGFTKTYVREIAHKTKDWPDVERVIGTTNFYSRRAIANFFRAYRGRPARKNSIRLVKKRRQ